MIQITKASVTRYPDREKVRMCLKNEIPYANHEIDPSLQSFTHPTHVDKEFLFPEEGYIPSLDFLKSLGYKGKVFYCEYTKDDLKDNPNSPRPSKLKTFTIGYG